MSLLHHDARSEALAQLSRFRGEFFSCLTARSDAFFELTDAVLCGDGPVSSLAEMSLVGEHRRGHGGLYAAPARGRSDTGRLRRAQAEVPLQRAADGRLFRAPTEVVWSGATCLHEGQFPALGRRCSRGAGERSLAAASEGRPWIITGPCGLSRRACGVGQTGVGPPTETELADGQSKSAVRKGR
ncbi:transposase [Streptomyces sp. NBC_01361]